MKRLNMKFDVKSLFTLTTGSVISQLIAVCCSVIITRLYGPEQIGTFTYVLSVSTLFMGVANLRYDIPIVTEASEKSVFPLIKLCLIIGLIVAIFVSLGVVPLFESNNIPVYWIVFVFLIVISFSIINTLSAYNNRQKEYKVISITYVIRSSFQNVGALAFGLFTNSALGLLLPYVFGQYFGINKQASSLKGRWKEIWNIKNAEVISMAKKHNKQPLYSAPAQLISGLSYSLITIIIAHLFGMSVVGYYSVSVRLLGLPLVLIAGNVSKVFLKEASQEYNQTTGYRKSLYRTFLMLLAMSIPLMTIIYFISPVLCEFFFGKGWGISGVYIQMLVPMFGIRFITSALSPAMVIAGKQKIELCLLSFFLIFNIVSYAISKQYDLHVESFLQLVNWLFFTAYLIYLVTIFKFSKVREQVYVSSE